MSFWLPDPRSDFGEDRRSRSETCELGDLVGGSGASFCFSGTDAMDLGDGEDFRGEALENECRGFVNGCSAIYWFFSGSRSIHR